jgi:hypothetical protein
MISLSRLQKSVLAQLLGGVIICIPNLKKSRAGLASYGTKEAGHIEACFMYSSSNPELLSSVACCNSNSLGGEREGCRVKWKSRLLEIGCVGKRSFIGSELKKVHPGFSCLLAFSPAQTSACPFAVAVVDDDRNPLYSAFHMEAFWASVSRQRV